MQDGKSAFALRGALIGVLLAGGASAANANFNGSDDFSGPTTFWGRQNFNATLTPTGGVLLYATGAAPSGNDSSVWSWAASFGSASESWSLQVDVALNVATPAGTFTNLSLGVVNRTDPDPNGDLFRIGVHGNRVVADAFADRVSQGQVGQLTSTASAAVGIQFDASSQMLTAAFDADGALNGYAFTPLFSMPLAAWGGFDGDTPFSAFLIAQTGNLSVPPGSMAFDNFQASPGALPVPEPQRYALMLAGLALLAAGPRLRRAAKPSRPSPASSSA